MLWTLLGIIAIIACLVYPVIAVILVLAFIGYNVVRLIIAIIEGTVLSGLIINGICTVIGLVVLIWAFT